MDLSKDLFLIDILVFVKIKKEINSFKLIDSWNASTESTFMYKLLYVQFAKCVSRTIIMSQFQCCHSFWVLPSKLSYTGCLFIITKVQ